MKWNAYANNDSLAMELTPNYNNNAGGFIVDPNAEQFGGTFAIGISEGETRNSIYIQRPSVGVWHHYAFVLDTTAAAEHEITPYVDGQQVSFQQEGKGTGGGPFANSTLYLMSRDASSLFGSGYLQDLAIYGGDLSAATIEEHHDANGTDPRPKAAFTATPNPVRPGQTVTFNASGSSYSEGSIKKYEWDLKGNGNYETTTTTPTVTTSYATAQTVDVGLRVTDSNGGWGDTSQAVEVGNFPPVAHVSVSPSVPLTGQKVTLNAAGSTDQGTITDYKWDLEGKGTYETDTGATPTVSTYFDTAGVHDVGLELTDNEGLTSKTTVPVKVLEQGPSGYTPTVLNTPGLIHYYKLAEAAGPTIFDSAGSSNGTIGGGTFGLPGAVRDDPSTAIGFNGTSDYGAIPLNLSGTSQLTVEFWLKWNGYANNDSLAMEFTPNFNEHEGGFLVDPDAPQFGGTFGVAIGSSENRYSVFFERPSAGVWHHYVLVLNGAAAAGSEITPYVDGQPVELPDRQRRQRRGRVRELDAVPDVARRQLAVRRRRAAGPRDLQPAAERRHGLPALQLRRHRRTAASRLHGLAQPGARGRKRDAQRRRLDRPRREDRRLPVGAERQRPLRNRLRLEPDDHDQLRHAGHLRSVAARDRRKRRVAKASPTRSKSATSRRWRS